MDGWMDSSTDGKGACGGDSASWFDIQKGNKVRIWKIPSNSFDGCPRCGNNLVPDVVSFSYDVEREVLEGEDNL